MNSKQLPRGMIVPIVTPLVEQDRLDVAALECQVERLVIAGVQGLFVLGTCGEGPSLSDRIKREIIERICRQIAGRTTAMVCATSPSAAEATALATYAADSGADMVVFAPPFFFPLTQAELWNYFEQRAAEVELPVLLYNYPALFKVSIEPDLVARLMDNSKIVGLKDSSGDLTYFKQACAIAQRRPGWRVYMGPEQLLVEAVRLGADGGVCAGANLLPELFVDIYEAAVTHDADRLAPMLRKATLLAKVYDCGEGPAAPCVRGLKAALAAMGIGNGLTADPLASADDAQRQQIAAILHDLGAARR